MCVLKYMIKAFFIREPIPFLTRANPLLEQVSVGYTCTFCWSLFWARRSIPSPTKFLTEAISVANTDPMPTDLSLGMKRERAVMRHRKDLTVQKRAPVWQFKEQDYYNRIPMVLRTVVNKLEICENSVIFTSINSSFTVGHAVCWPVGTSCHTRLCASAFTELPVQLWK